MLVAGVVGTALAVALALALPLAAFGDPMFGVPSVVVGVSPRVVGSVAGVAAALVGLVWMIRIFRGPRDEPPAWRYRDR